MTSALPSLSSVGADDFAPRYRSSKESYVEAALDAEAAAAAASVAAADADADAALALDDALDADVAACCA